MSIYCVTEEKMSDQEFHRQARKYFLPFLLGNNKEARGLAAKISRRLRISSFILDERPSFKNPFALSYYFAPLTPTDEPRLLCEQLIDYAMQNPSALPILVSTEARYREITEQNRELLERYFIIREPNALLQTPPLSSID